MNAFPRPFNCPSNPDVSGVRPTEFPSPEHRTCGEPTVAEEIAHLHAQLGAHIRRQAADPMNSSAVFLVRLSMQLEALKKRAIEEDLAEETARAKIGAVRRVMGIADRKAA